MNNTMITNTFSSDNRNITKTITNENLKFEPMIKTARVTNYAFFTAVTVVV